MFEPKTNPAAIAQIKTARANSLTGFSKKPKTVVRVSAIPTGQVATGSGVRIIKALERPEALALCECSHPRTDHDFEYDPKADTAEFTRCRTNSIARAVMGQGKCACKKYRRLLANSMAKSADGWWQDNPAKDCEDQGHSNHPDYCGHGWLKKNPRGTTAGYRNAQADPNEVAKLPGAAGEEHRIRQSSLDYLHGELQEHGFRRIGSPLVIVDHAGQAKIYEGNHRTRAAANLGMKQIPVEVRYEGGSERIPGVWKPGALKKGYIGDDEPREERDYVGYGGTPHEHREGEGMRDIRDHLQQQHGWDADDMERTKHSPTLGRKLTGPEYSGRLFRMHQDEHDDSEMEPQKVPDTLPNDIRDMKIDKSSRSIYIGRYCPRCNTRPSKGQGRWTQCQKCGHKFDPSPPDFRTYMLRPHEQSVPGSRYKATVAGEGSLAWDEQAEQHPAKGPAGIEHRKETISPAGMNRWTGRNERAKHVNILTHRNEGGDLTGILYHYPQHIGPEKRGNINLMVHPEHRRQGIGQKLLGEADKRWGLKPEKQGYTPGGAASMEAYTRKKESGLLKGRGLWIRLTTPGFEGRPISLRRTKRGLAFKKAYGDCPACKEGESSTDAIDKITALPGAGCSTPKRSVAEFMNHAKTCDKSKFERTHSGLLAPDGRVAMHDGYANHQNITDRAKTTHSYHSLMSHHGVVRLSGPMNGDMGIEVHSGGSRTIQQARDAADYATGNAMGVKWSCFGEAHMGHGDTAESLHDHFQHDGFHKSFRKSNTTYIGESARHKCGYCGSRATHLGQHPYNGSQVFFCNKHDQEYGYSFGGHLRGSQPPSERKCKCTHPESAHGPWNGDASGKTHCCRGCFREDYDTSARKTRNMTSYHHFVEDGPDSPSAPKASARGQRLYDSMTRLANDPAVQPGERANALAMRDRARTLKSMRTVVLVKARTKRQGDGDCYSTVGRHIMSDDYRRGDHVAHGTARLLHDAPDLQGNLVPKGTAYGHAWIERGKNVIDRSNGLDVTMPKEDYYALGRIDPASVKRYSQKEAMGHMSRTGHFGPWDDETKKSLSDWGNRKYSAPERSKIEKLPHDPSHVNSIMRYATRHIGPEDWKAGEDWHHGARQTIEERTGGDPVFHQGIQIGHAATREHVAQGLASMSPRVGWGTGAFAMDKVHGREMVGNTSNSGIGLHNSVKRARTALRGGGMGSGRSGKKTRALANASLIPVHPHEDHTNCDHELPIDVHADRVIHYGRPVDHGETGLSGPRHEQHSNAFRVAAARMGKEPHALHFASWVSTRRRLATGNSGAGRGVKAAMSNEDSRGQPNVLRYTKLWPGQKGEPRLLVNSFGFSKSIWRRLPQGLRSEVHFERRSGTDGTEPNASYDPKYKKIGLYPSHVRYMAPGWKGPARGRWSKDWTVAHEMGHHLACTRHQEAGVHDWNGLPDRDRKFLLKDVQTQHYPAEHHGPEGLAEGYAHLLMGQGSKLKRNAPAAHAMLSAKLDNAKKYWKSEAVFRKSPCYQEGVRGSSSLATLTKMMVKPQEGGF